jgi:hypothetical protein
MFLSLSSEVVSCDEWICYYHYCQHTKLQNSVLEISLLVYICVVYSELFVVLCSFFLLLFIVLVTVHCSCHFVHCYCYCSFATLTEVFLYFSSVVRQMPGYNSQDGARPALPNFPFSVLFSYLCTMRTVCV